MILINYLLLTRPNCRQPLNATYVLDVKQIKLEDTPPSRYNLNESIEPPKTLRIVLLSGEY